MNRDDGVYQLSHAYNRCCYRLWACSHGLTHGFIQDFTSGGVSKNQGVPLPSLSLPSLPLPFPPFP